MDSVFVSLRKFPPSHTGVLSKSTSNSSGGTWTRRSDPIEGGGVLDSPSFEGSKFRRNGTSTRSVPERVRRGERGRGN